MHTIERTIVAPDGRALAGRLYVPDREAGPAVLIAGATGVPQQFYGRFASWLAGRGATVLTFDYRGVGGSRHAAGPRRDPATMADWGRYDVNAAIDHLLDVDEDRPLAVVGHSAGGWLLSLAPNAMLVSTVLTVASQSGYWRMWRGWGRLKRFATWHMTVPALARLTGVLPGRFLGGQTLPAGVALDWARWGRSPSFIQDEVGLGPERRFSGRLLAVGVPGDPFAPEPAVRWLPNLYPRARSRVLMLDSAYRRLGHFGAFRPAAAPLWPEAWAHLQRA
jgi:predicted alpha/beta hydrolase